MFFVGLLIYSTNSAQQNLQQKKCTGKDFEKISKDVQRAVVLSGFEILKNENIQFISYIFLKLNDVLNINMSNNCPHLGNLYTKKTEDIFNLYFYCNIYILPSFFN